MRRSPLAIELAPTYTEGKRGLEAMMDGWGWLWGAFMMLLFWGRLAAMIVFAVRAFGGTSRKSSREAIDAETILETRFARGEISREESEERKRVLESRAA
jgi:putative membrane protein